MPYTVFSWPFGFTVYVIALLYLLSILLSGMTTSTELLEITLPLVLFSFVSI